MCRPHLTVPPGSRKTIQKLVEVGIAVRKHVELLSARKVGEMRLNRADFIE
jgi:hypothetical protein